MMLRRFVLLLLLALTSSASCLAQADTSPPPIARELRAVWIATVDNIDWPSRQGLSTAEQQRDMIGILDRLVELRMNAVIFQVRPAADALYDSRLEPWSEYLSGQMGRAPQPFYDPLAFTVAEAHKRGLELHVWINPYRSRYSMKKPAASNHISRTHPRLVHKYGPYEWMDPGEPAVRKQTEDVVLDLVRRYDIDGVHMDDYFYPYPETRRVRRKVNEIPFPDEATYRRYTRGGGTLSRDDWRRHNVDLLVKELYDGVHAVKPWIKFGVSPFGIWRPGHPASVRGLDQYAVLYADAKKWLNEGWVDYLTPQLYWAADKPEQRYDQLLKWWVGENLMGRHIWPGNYTGKVAFTNPSGAQTPAGGRWPIKTREHVDLWLHGFAMVSADSSAVPLYKFAHDRQARAGTATKVFPAVQTLEHFKNLIEMVRRNADAIVLHVKHGLPFGFGREGAAT